MPSRALAVTAKSGLAALGVAVALSAIAGASVAQPKPAAQPSAADAATLDKGRDIFSNYGCGSCHSLSDAGTTGHVGPALDENANLSQDFIVGRVTNGQGMMPSFGGQLSQAEINTLASYIMKVAMPPK